MDRISQPADIIDFFFVPFFDVEMIVIISAELIRAARAMLGLTQQEMADAAGLERRVVARLETGQTNVSMQQFLQIKAAFEERGIEFVPASATYGAGLRWRSP